MDKCFCPLGDLGVHVPQCNKITDPINLDTVVTNLSDSSQQPSRPSDSDY